MVFRRDSKVDAFQRQISALRNQLGGEPAELPAAVSGHGDGREHELTPLPVSGRSLPDLDFFSESTYTLRDELDVPPPQVAVVEPAATLSSPVPAHDAETSIIAHGTSWSGNLESSGSLHVHGRVDGSLVARNSIYVAEDAEVDATLQAAHVIVAGLVRGSVRCLERFEVLPRGRVSGDVRAPRMVIHDGAVVAGEVSMSAEAAAPAAPVRAARGG
ncbi:MAG: polymer-forming cytoskeletal protein [Thermomicrobiales bacterium]|nr:polymer-forming cytoskeletal protein [Thermomicrobiales bacterium]